MATDAGGKPFTPMILEAPLQLLREQAPIPRKARPRTTPRTGETALNGLFPAACLTPPALCHRSRIILAGAYKIEERQLQALDQIGAQLAAQIFVLHEHPSPAVMLEQVHDLPSLDPAASHDLLARACAFFSLSVDSDDPFLSAAAAAGCPLVLLDTPSLRARFEWAASFVQIENAAASAQALRRMLEDPEHRQRMALAAFRRAPREPKKRREIHCEHNQRLPMKPV